jgi:hypothetical protein
MVGIVVMLIFNLLVEDLVGGEFLIKKQELLAHHQHQHTQ